MNHTSFSFRAAIVAHLAEAPAVAAQQPAAPQTQ
jgi:hypothetical protein